MKASANPYNANSARLRTRNQVFVVVYATSPEAINSRPKQNMIHAFQ